MTLCVGAVVASGAVSAWAQDDPPADAPAEEKAEATAEATAGTTTEAPAADADADADKGKGGKYPLQYVRRPLTLPAMTLAPEASFSLFKLGDLDPIILAGLGASFGILDDLEVSALAVPLLLSPEVDYGDPIIGATYRFLRGEFEMGARVRFAIPVQSDFVLLAGVPMLLHIGDSLRLDTGVNFSFAFGDEVAVGLLGLGTSPLSFQPGIPIDLSVQLADPFWITAGTGFGIASFDAAGDTMFIPLGAGLGFSIAGENESPMLDITARFDFPLFLTPGGPEAVNPDFIAVGAAGRFYLPL